MTFALQRKQTHPTQACHSRDVSSDLQYLFRMPRLQKRMNAPYGVSDDVFGRGYAQEGEYQPTPVPASLIVSGPLTLLLNRVAEPDVQPESSA